MRTEVKNISQTDIELTITIEAEEALKDYREVFGKFKNQIVIPGFRKGKAPISMIEKTYGEYLKQDFYDKKLDSYFKKALEELELNPTNQPEASKMEWEKNKDLTAVFKFEVFPKRNISKYKDIEVPFEKQELNDRMIDDTITNIRNNMAAEVDADSPSKKEDIIHATIKFLDENKDITKEIERSFVLGANQYSEEFNINLTGLKAGDEVTTKLFTSEQQSDDDQIGDNIKDRDFIVKVNTIKRKILPVPDDEFAKDVDFESLDDMRDKIGKEIQTDLDNRNKQSLHHAIIYKIIELNPFEIPKSIIHKHAEDLVRDQVRGDQSKLAEFAEIYHSIAEMDLKKYFILHEIRKLEKIEISEEDKEAVIVEAASHLKIDVDKYKEMFKKQIESEDFVSSIEERKIYEILEQNSKIVPFPKEEIK